MFFLKYINSFYYLNSYIYKIWNPYLFTSYKIKVDATPSSVNQSRNALHYFPLWL